MSACASIDTEAPRFYVSTIEGFPIRPGEEEAGTGGRTILVATVIDSFYGTEHGRFASNDAWTRGGEWIASPGRGYQARRGHAGALAAAGERCAELNAWHEREGWMESLPPLGGLLAS